MKKFVISLFAFSFALLSASAVTATKEYVDKSAANTYRNAVEDATASANAYTDNAVQQAGSVTPVAVTNISRIVTSTIVTKSFVEGLGIESGVTSVNGKTGTVSLSAGDVGAAAVSEVEGLTARVGEAQAAANEANAYSMATYNFMNGNTNAWFSGTNYVFGADATNKHHFVFEDGMHLRSMPCSMSLWEIRDGIRQNVWDQRDWVSWYWSFKAGQMRQEIAEADKEIRAAMTNYAPRAWSKMTAATGLENPDRSTTWIDTKNVTLSPGMAWETVATVDGCGYWTIVGNGAVIGGSGANAVLMIKDFEGKDIMTVTKGEHRLAWIESSDFTGQTSDADGWVCFDMRADVQPTGYYSTTLEMSDFVPETDAGCPAQCRWENMGGGIWRVHFLLKPGIVSPACFAKFQVEVEGQTIIRYNAGHEISGGLIYNGVKIAPDVSGHPAVGTVVQWKVVN
jgi:hypothetical protein